MENSKPSLEALRARIDEIDEALHDLLMERARVVEGIADAKGGGPVSRPGREAQVLRRIAARHGGSFPLPAVFRIWREIITACSYIQGGFKVAYFSADVGMMVRSLTRDHYGTLAELIACGSPAQVLQRVMEDANVIGVLPFPESGEAGCWWPNLLRSGADAPRIIARLPFSGRSQEASGEALAISLIEPEPSGDDSSFLVVELSEPVSRGSLKGLLENAGLEVVALQGDAGRQELQLLEVSGFVTEGHPSLARLRDGGDSRILQCWSIGAAARPYSAE